MTSSLAWLYALLTAVIGFELAADRASIWDVLKILVLGILAMQISYFASNFIVNR
jgi:hypothetical protein